MWIIKEYVDKIETIGEDETEMIKYALEHLHDADLSEFGKNNILMLENLMNKFDCNYLSKIDF